MQLISALHVHYFFAFDTGGQSYGFSVWHVLAIVYHTLHMETAFLHLRGTMCDT